MTLVVEDLRQLAERAVSSFRDRSRDRLDFSEDSLDVVEEILAEASAYHAQLSQHVIAGIVQELGSYVLFVALQKYGGRFLWLDSTEEPVLVAGEPDRHIALTAWSKVRGRLQGDTGDHIPFFYRGFAERMSNAPIGTHVLLV
jgi:hypothetical protein